jgi:endonuclease/exonuclease/phosphatase family metal-dependent hydrolase
MRVVSWNLHGAAVPGRSSIQQQQRAWNYMRDELHADLILAQEVTTGGIPSEVLGEWTVVSGERGRFRKDWNWGSVIAARPSLHLENRSDACPEKWLAQLYDLVLIGEISVDGAEGFTVASIHTVAMPVTNWLQQYATTLTLTTDELESLRRPDCREHPYINDFAFTALERLLRGRRFLVAGDWNTCSSYAGGPRFFDRARDSGWIRCHGETEIPTYFTKSGRSYPLDHAFCDTVTERALTSASVISNDLVQSLSDHAPIVVDLTLREISAATSRDKRAV